MLTSLRIQNFKTWKDTGEVRLAPLTVIFGANSSGKSSILQLLLMLKQTAQSADRLRVLHFGDPQTPVDLGTYRDAVFEHDVSLSLEFTLQWKLERETTFIDSISDDQYSGRTMRFGCKIGQTSPEDEDISVQRMRYRLGESGSRGLAVTMELRKGESGKYDLESEEYKLVRNQGRPWSLPRPRRFYGFPDEAIAYYQNSGFLSDLMLALEHLLGRTHYLGPLRDYPKRIYTWAGTAPEHVGWHGEQAIEALLAAKSRRISPGFKKRAKSIEETAAQWLKVLGLIEDFAVKRITKHGKQYEVLVRTPGSRENVGITDVGFGVSQVLPVVVQCLYARPNSTLLFEQPEIHLHPAVQSALADLFIEAIHSREGGRDRKIQFVVESHSEHFLRRIQRRIAEESLKPEDAALYFCKPGRQGATIEKLEVDEYGNIHNWPANFFGDEMGDIAAQTIAAMERKKGQDAA